MVHIVTAQARRRNARCGWFVSLAAEVIVRVAGPSTGTRVLLRRGLEATDRPRQVVISGSDPKVCLVGMHRMDVSPVGA